MAGASLWDLEGILGERAPGDKRAPGERAPDDKRALELAHSAKPPKESLIPSIGRQKSFIVENASILDKGTKVAILSVVMMEIGAETDAGVIIVAETGAKDAREVDIDLDAVARENEDVLGHIYNIVNARRELLNQPLRQTGRRADGAGEP